MPAVDAFDVVDPDDAAMQELLAQIAGRTADKEKRERIHDLNLMLPPIAQWPPEILDEWREIYDDIRGYRLSLERREFQRMVDDGEII